MANENSRQDLLANGNIPSLLIKFSVPSIIAMLVGSLYNIVDQFFIGQKLGEVGNAATNVSFPLSILCLAIALMFGIGGASVFGMSIGRSQYDSSETEHARIYMGNSITMLFFLGTVLLIVTQLYLNPMLDFFGAPDSAIGYARTYTRIISIGFPFSIVSIGGGHLLRADGSPRYTMICNVTGAVVNTVLDAVFMNVFDWGIAGAAYATIIGQFIAFILIVYHLAHTKTVSLSRECFIPDLKHIRRIALIGIAPCLLQLAVMVVQIAMNKSLKYYGALSSYGDTIPLACAGIISKVNSIYMAFVIGISQGMQPIASFNYGRKQYRRVKSTFLTAISFCSVFSVIAFWMFQLFPRQIISFFGKGTEEYFTFAEQYFRIFLFFVFIYFFQMLSSNFYTSIGKPRNGILLSLSRQILLFLPLLIILPRYFGISGILYAGPIADSVTVILCIILCIREFRRPEYNAD